MSAAPRTCPQTKCRLTGRSRCSRPRSPGSSASPLPPTSCTSFRPPPGRRHRHRLLGTLDLTAAGSLHRCHQALEAHARTEGYDADEWLPLAYEQAADWLEHASAAVDPPALIDHAQQAGRYAAVAIGSLDRNAPNATEAITDTLAHLLTVCVFADTAPTHR